MTRIENKFAQLKAEESKAFIPYITAGDPNLDTTLELVLALERAGADIIELGVPFSDPIADGPVIQKAAERALRSGTSLRRILPAVSALRAKTQIPLVLMAYYNTIYAFGEPAFCRQAVEAGMDGSQVAAIADGVIVGSAIVRQIEEHQHDPHLSERVGAFVRSLKSAMTHGRVEVKA